MRWAEVEERALHNSRRALGGFMATSVSCDGIVGRGTGNLQKSQLGLLGFKDGTAPRTVAWSRVNEFGVRMRSFQACPHSPHCMLSLTGGVGVINGDSLSAIMSGLKHTAN